MHQNSWAPHYDSAATAVGGDIDAWAGAENLGHNSGTNQEMYVVDHGFKSSGLWPTEKTSLTAELFLGVNK